MIQQIPLVGITATAPIINPDIRVAREFASKEPFASTAVNSNSGARLRNTGRKKEKQTEVSIYFDEDGFAVPEPAETPEILAAKNITSFSSLFLTQVIAQQSVTAEAFFSKVRIIKLAADFIGITFEALGFKGKSSVKKVKTHEIKFANDNSDKTFAKETYREAVVADNPGGRLELIG